MSVARALVVATLLATIGGASPAAAQPKPSSAGPEAKFEAAQKRYDQREYKAALALFRETLEATGSPNAGLYVARCLRELGQLTDAYQEMRRTLRSATERAATESRYAATRDAAKSELGVLETKVGRVTVSVEGATGVEVTINGAKLAPEDVGQPVGVTPGAVTITATAPGKAPFSREVRVAAGVQEKVDVAFTDVGTAPAPPSVPDAPPEKRGGEIRTAGFAVAGIGVVGVVVFAITGSMAKSKFSTIEDECGHTRCVGAQCQDEIDSGKTLTTLANVGLVTGIVGIAAGGAMIAFGGPRTVPAQTGLAFAGSPAGARVAYAGRF